jgi:acetoin:2,6-dichlorophenolindophenol oxidoreductase subunit alpha
MSQSSASNANRFKEGDQQGRMQSLLAGSQSQGQAQANTSEAALWLSMYEQMLTIRLFEEHVNQLYLTARMPGLAHLYIGEEAIAVGVCAALRRDDYITSTHRGHGHCLAKGASVDLMFAELLGKEAGYCHGKGGSMHIADQETGNLGANAIVGGSAGIATGAAMSSKMRGSDQVAVCFFGDGALGQGMLYEVMNMASLWKLPVIYVCEDNHYNEYTHNSETTAGEIRARGKAFGMVTEEVDGQDVRAVHAAASRMVERARRGEGPSFLLCDTYRYHGHHVGDIQRSYYRSKEEEEHWKTNRDPLQLLTNWLVEQGVADSKTFEQIEERVQAEVSAGEQFALNAPYPQPDEVEQHVYA